MSGERLRCVVVVGGSDSVHVTVPARMIREAGHRVVLANLQDEVAPKAAEVFDAVYPLGDAAQRFLLRGRSAAPSAKPSYEIQPIKVETPRRMKSYLWRLGQGYLRSRQLGKIVARERPGVVHFQSMSAGGMTCYYWLKHLGWVEPARRPGLLTHLWGYAPRYPGVRRRETRALKEFDHIHTSSPAVARMYREHYEVRAEQISVFVRGIDLEVFAPRSEEVLAAARTEWGVPADKFVIIHNRHLHRMYRVDIVIDSFIELARRGHDVFLILVRGSMCQDDYERELLGKLADHGLADRVAMMPPVLSADQMATALQLADCAVN